MTLQVQTQFTLEQYFDLEYQAPVRHEFVDGKMRTMPYTSENHGLIVSNLIANIHFVLSDTNCRVYPSDRMLFIKATENVFYPDVMVVCGKSEFKDHKKTMQATMNPKVLIEVLSPSTEHRDHHKKNIEYRQIPSLEQYILVAQDTIGIQIFSRQNNSDKWTSELFDENSKSIEIVGAKIEISKIYKNVEFSELEEK